MKTIHPPLPLPGSLFASDAWVLKCVIASFLLAGTAGAATRYVWQDNPGAASPYTNWATAAATIQDAVDAAESGDTVLVTNGVYSTGGRVIHGTITNRVAMSKPLTLLSVNGPGATIIRGYRETTPPYGAVRCVYLTNGATLSGFTLSNGGTLSSGNSVQDQSGAGVWCESANAVITNCVLEGNSARSSLDPNAGNGGGAYRGTLIRCILRRNSAHDGAGAYASVLSSCLLAGNSTRHPNGLFGRGGGASQSTLNGCTLVGNEAAFGGGARGGTLNNCISYFNHANSGTNHDLATLNYSCSTPLPVLGVSIITNAPLFVDTNDWANVRLQPGSPCIDAGSNALVTSGTDLEGNPRIIGGTVDMGAYEFVPTDTNTPPIADASATPTRVLYAGGACCPKHGGDGLEGQQPESCRLCSNLATVVLDGSRSSDPDGDPLTYLWLSTLNQLPSTPIATGVVATVRVPAGVHAIDLVVDDGQSQDTNTVTITVLTAERAVQRLIRIVNASDVNKKRPLLASLEAALDSIQRRNCHSAVGQLSAFQHKVRAQISDPALAGRLIGGVDQVIAALGADGSPPIVCEVRSLKRKPDGGMRLEFNGAAGAAYLLEASTNMVDWKAICVVRPGDDGRCEFEDAEAARHASRFYRLRPVED